MRTQNSAKAKLRVIATNPILPALVLPAFLNDLYINVNWESVDDVSNGDIELVLRISDIVLLGFRNF